MSSGRTAESRRQGRRPRASPRQRVAGEEAAVEKLVGDVVDRRHVAVGLGRCAVQHLQQPVEKLEDNTALAANDPW